MMMMNRRNVLHLMGQSSIVPLFIGFPAVGRRPSTVDLTRVRSEINRHFRSILPQKQAYGSYLDQANGKTDLYASCDVAIARHIMGERLPTTLTTSQREAWITHINTYQNPEDGSYRERYRHAKLHANGMTIGALGALGGRQKYPVKLYKAFNTVEKVGLWLAQINWAKQWGGSHLFWGGIHCYSMSTQCSSAWVDAVFQWLNDHLDERTGWWKEGVVPTDCHQPLGGGAHILPIYQHHRRAFPYPERVIDSVLALQLPNGRWLSRSKDQQHVMHYLELDALYALQHMGTLVPGYRKKAIQQSAHRYANLVCAYWNDPMTHWKAQHPHRILSMVGTFGLLQKLLPDRFLDQIRWTDIFSDIQLYNTAAVEKVP